MNNIPFNKPYYSGNEFEYIRHALENSHISGDGEFTRNCSRILENILGSPKVLLTCSCTHALEMAAILLDIKPGDEVIVPSFTFVSTANSFVLRGAKPVFADIQPDTLNIDCKDIRKKITEKTKAVICVHYAGVACDMDELMEICSTHNIHLVEDNAHGFLGTYKGKLLGTFGTFGTLSFHETKNISCGEGGALIINKTEYIERAEIIREKGTDRSKFFRGEIDKYSWIDIGSSFLPSDILAAFLHEQLDSIEYIQSKRKSIWEYYYTELSEWGQQYNIRLPYIPEDRQIPWHLFYLLFSKTHQRDAFIEYMRQNGIQCAFHYLPLHLSKMGRKFGGKGGDCPVAEQISETLVRLPFFTGMTEEEMEYVVKKLKELYFKKKVLKNNVTKSLFMC